MSKDTFLQTLKQGLKGLPPEEIEEILGDYAAHFADSAACGRQEEEVAIALGDPARLARELRADAGLRRLERDWSVSNMLRAMLALTGLVIVDILFLLPFLLFLALVTLAAGFAMIVLGTLGLKILFVTLSDQVGNTIASTLSHVFIGVGLISACVGGSALLLMALSGGIRVIGHYSRLHFQFAHPKDPGNTFP
ncbi:DUF1700 domain-containing protein [Allorhizobium sp. BGMRC 0089]|uniref:DUF1700 domain-containing protein n=1 Tax=Allorhizobium sonneratiae TaxID=2934936 RepID=UPI0020336474|nr:DUF1700 domain-containing protein [Allorhizobium sonneratiae]MCM2292822.1 DUF1700 domain-containing protein [Allorhizobium sonneratiae]